MAFSYRWNFDPLEVEYSSASLANVVSVVHWQYHAETVGTSSLGVSGSFTATNIGTEALSSVASADFVAYGDLTEAIVTGWVTGSMGDDRVTEIQTNVSRSLVDQLAPPTGTKSNPW